jgi:hypothetical protein
MDSTGTGMWYFFNSNAAGIQAGAAIVSLIATIALILITRKYVRLTGDLATAASKQIRFHEEAQVAKLNELGTYLKLAGMILASFPTEQAEADRLMRQSLSWDGFDFARFQELATGLGPIEGKHAAIAVGAISYLRDRAREVRSVNPLQGFNWSQFGWKDYGEKLEQALGRIKDIQGVLNTRLQPPA